jgi:hypothetical protein
MHSAEDVSEGNLGWWPSQQVAAFFAPDTASDPLGFEFDQDLDQIIGRNTLVRRQVFHADRHTVEVVLGQSEHGPGGIVALNR